MFSSLFLTKPKKKTESKEVLIYRNCRELPIHNFNECMNGDMTYLIAGKRTPNAVKLFLQTVNTEQVWLEIMNEYIELSKNNRAKKMLQNKNKIIWLQRRLNVLELIQQGIDEGYDVSEYLTEYKLKKEKVKSQIALAKNELARLAPKNENHEDEKSKNDFDTSIAYILENGYQINRFTTVVSEYCEILNRIEQKNRLAKSNQLK